MPQRWTALWELLPDRKRVGGGWEPALPLILAAWHDTPGMQKMLRLAEHIEWATEHGALESVADFLRGLREDEWFHLEDCVARCIHRLCRHRLLGRGNTRRQPEGAARISGRVRLAVQIDALQDALEAMHGRGASSPVLS